MELLGQSMAAAAVSSTSASVFESAREFTIKLAQHESMLGWSSSIWLPFAQINSTDCMEPQEESCWPRSTFRPAQSSYPAWTWWSSASSAQWGQICWNYLCEICCWICVWFPNFEDIPRSRNRYRCYGWKPPSPVGPSAGHSQSHGQTYWVYGTFSSIHSR